MSIFDIFKKKKASEIIDPERIATLAAEIDKLAKYAIRMDVDNKVRSVRSDGCKIGGKPFLPADFVWPVFTNEEEDLTRPLSFFCQLNLADVTAYDTEGLLPSHGLLSFFYECESFCWGFDPKHKGAARVFYFDDTTDFSPFDIPKDLDEKCVMPEMAVKFTTEKSYPGYEEFITIHSDPACDWDNYDRALTELGVNTDEDPEGHKLLGYADIIQSEMLTDCERAIRGLCSGDPESFENTPDDIAADIQQKAKDWTLLLQLGTIEKGEFEWMFGDCGMLYYYIKKEDLAAKRFENMWFAVQCG